MEIVDAQIHLWQNDAAPPHHRQAPFRIEDALEGMDGAGIARAVNCPAVWDPHANDYAVEATTRHPDRFATLGWFPLDGPADPAAADRLLGRPGMLGMRFILAAPHLAGRLADGGLDWLWARADLREAPVALMVLPDQLPLLHTTATRFPKMRILVDHLAVLPFLTLPRAAEHLDDLLALARHPNIAVKASGAPGMATDPYPFPSTHDVLHRTVEAFGPDRVFWGTDITRMPCDWRACVTHFTEHLPWLTGTDLELVMGRAVRNWIGWH